MSYGWVPVIKSRTVVRKERRLPLPGEIHVKIGDMVTPDTIVASARAPHGLHEVDVANVLGVDAEVAEHFIIKKIGAETTTDEIIAVRPKFFFRSERVCKSPINGVIRGISKGRVLIQEIRQLEIRAYIPGTVVEKLDDEGVAVETPAMLIQGIFGVGGEIYGELMMIQSSNNIITEKDISPNCKGKLLAGGSLVTLEALRKAVATGVRGIIVGGIEQKDLVDFLGYEIDIPTTGNEDIGITLILIEGFGRIPMNDKTFQLLQSSSGRQTCINGSTQIRLNVIRPEVIIPLKKET
jgi:hypothetical protein